LNGAFPDPCAFEKKSWESNASSRWNANMRPFTSFVPERVITVTTAPDASPYSALNWLAMTANSRTASSEKPPRLPAVTI
jgi:hypothetical protein